MKKFQAFALCLSTLTWLSACGDSEDSDSDLGLTAGVADAGGAGETGDTGGAEETGGEEGADGGEDEGGGEEDSGGGEEDSGAADEGGGEEDSGDGEGGGDSGIPPIVEDDACADYTDPGIENFSVGGPVNHLTGLDAYGEPTSLCRFAGKPTVVDMSFWGCPPCEGVSAWLAGDPEDIHDNYLGQKVDREMIRDKVKRRRARIRHDPHRQRRSARDRRRREKVARRLPERQHHRDDRCRPRGLHHRR